MENAIYPLDGNIMALLYILMMYEEMKYELCKKPDAECVFPVVGSLCLILTAPWYGMEPPIWEHDRALSWQMMANQAHIAKQGTRETHVLISRLRRVLGEIWRDAFVSSPHLNTALLINWGLRPAPCIMSTILIRHYNVQSAASTNILVKIHWQ